jgi:hypothetical protein
MVLILYVEFLYILHLLRKARGCCMHVFCSCSFIPASTWLVDRAVVIYPHNHILKFKICASTFDYKQYSKLTIKLYMKRDQNLFDQKQSPEQT